MFDNSASIHHFPKRLTSRIRHEKYAYSYIKVDPTKDGYVHMTIYNFENKEWCETPA